MMQKIGAATGGLTLLVFLLLLSNDQLKSDQRTFRALIHTSTSAAENRRYETLSLSTNLTVQELQELESTLARATFGDEKNVEDNTVMIAALNKAWADGGMFDNFLDSFHSGDDIRYMLDHLVVVSLDPDAQNSCLSKHQHCFSLSTPGVDFSPESLYMTDNYLKAMKRKVQFLGAVLKLGYSFVFTDVDIIWFRAPFKHFSKQADVDISCNHDFTGNSSDLNNQPNGGLLHVRSNARSIKFYDEWYRQHASYPDKHDQDVLNAFKMSPEFAETGVRIKFMPTDYFSGYCRLSSDMEKVCSMHATCCIGQGNKLAALKDSGQDWKLFMSATPQESREAGIRFRSPRNCL